ncbi:MAG: hypothetical protein N2167_03595 [Flavobacteriales bacterium]|nr:hypothetical protein [Flavobacteriales bacterium]
MKNVVSIISTFILSFIVFSVNAVDLCVNESGSGGCYSSITAALAAANDGDRIIIQPKAGGVPYTENLTINKSVQLLSNAEGTFWVMQGNITITPAVGRKISILHMRNIVGDITASGNSPAGTRCEVNIMNCRMDDGNINLDYNNFNVNVVSNQINDGSVALRYGQVIGNEIKADATSDLQSSAFIYLNTDGVATNDTLYVVGNRINYLTDFCCYDNIRGITLNSSSQFFYVSNNLIIAPSTSYTYNSSYYFAGILINSAKNSSIGQNFIVNNTVYSTATYYTYGITFNGHASNATTNVLNNLILLNNNSNNSSIVGTSSGIIAASYNYSNRPFSNLSNNGTNNLTSNTTINTSTGQMNVGSDGINGGYPDPVYYDLNLTVNDVGVYGGSYSLDNFYPVTGSARVYFVRAPRTVLQSGTLNIRAESFDR